MVQKYIRSSFFAGRDFAGVAQMVAEARRWSLEVAERRTPRVREGCTPLEVFASEEAGVLRPLPSVPFGHARCSPMTASQAGPITAACARHQVGLRMKIPTFCSGKSAQSVRRPPGLEGTGLDQAAVMKDWTRSTATRASRRTPIQR